MDNIIFNSIRSENAVGIEFGILLRFYLCVASRYPTWQYKPCECMMNWSCNKVKSVYFHFRAQHAAIMVTLWHGHMFRTSYPLCAKPLIIGGFLAKKGQWYKAMIISLLSAWINFWKKNSQSQAGAHRCGCDVMVMILMPCSPVHVYLCTCNE